MIPKLHAKGSSFKGAAQYLLHDKGRAQSSERVAWTQARNITVEDPDVAWRLMAATAMDQQRLKAQAGVRNTGRKSNKHVLHFTLSWHPDQNPTREQMIEAADGAIAALGASDRQAMIIANNDEKHTHLHVMLNRVSPEDGRHLSSSKEKLKLSQWAQEYEESTGEIFCENRIINNAMRNGGDYIRGEKDKPRHIFEEQQAAAGNDNDRTKAIAEEQRRKDAALALKSRNQAAMQRRAAEKLVEAHVERKAALARALQRQILDKRKHVQEEFRPKWRDLNQHQRAELETFEALEQKGLGRVANMAKTLRLTNSDIGGETTNVITRSFKIITQAGARKEYFEKAQEAARKALQRQQAEQASQAVEALKTAQEAKLEANRVQYFQERDQLARNHAAQDEALKLQWRERTAERSAAYQQVQPKPKERTIISEQELSRLRALEEIRRSQHKPANDTSELPTPPPSHKVDFDQVRKDLRDRKDKDVGQSQSDDDMDI